MAYTDNDVDPDQKKAQDILTQIGLHPAQQQAQEALWRHAASRGTIPASPVPVPPLVKTPELTPPTAPATPNPEEQDRAQEAREAGVTPPGRTGAAPGGGAATTTLGPGANQPQEIPAGIIPGLSSPLGGKGIPALRPATPVNPDLIGNTQARTLADQAEYDRMLKTGSGISQINNPFLRNLAKVGDIAGQVLFPRAEEAIPGTEGHHRELMGQEAGRVNRDLAQRKEEGATEESEARAAKEAQPTPEVYKEVTGASGPGGEAQVFGEHSGEVKTLPGTKVKPPAGKEDDEPLKNHEQMDSLIARRWDVLNAGKPVPPELKLPENPTVGDYKRVSGELEKIENSTATEAQRKEANDLKRQMIDLAGQRQTQSEKKLGMDLVIGTDPKSGRTIAVPESQADKLGMEDAYKVGAAEVEKITNARSLMKLLNNNSPDDPGIIQLVDKMDKEGKLGPLTGRWEEFMAGKIGKGDPEYTVLRTKLNGLESTALAQVHVGARGTSYLIEHFKDLADAGKMDGPTLKAAVETEYKYVKNNKALIAKDEPIYGREETRPYHDGKKQYDIPVGPKGDAIIKSHNLQPGELPK